MNAITARGQRFEAHPARIRYVGGTTGLRAGMVKRSVGQCRARACQRNGTSERTDALVIF